MNRSLPSIFFTAAGLLLAATKIPDIFTVAAVAACALIAVISCSRHAGWSAIGGTLLIGMSLILQAALSYRCLDCIKADLLMLAGVICISVMEKGGIEKALKLMAAVTTVILMVNAAMHYPIFAVQPLEAAQSGEVGRFIDAFSGGNRVPLDTSVKPVLLFSPSCGACRSLVGKLAQADPGGKGWVPAQVGGETEEGSALLDSAGYRGNRYQSEAVWNEAIPALITTREGKTKAVYGQEEILKAVRGDSG